MSTSHKFLARGQAFVLIQILVAFEESHVIAHGQIPGDLYFAGRTGLVALMGRITFMISWANFSTRFLASVIFMVGVFCHVTDASASVATIQANRAWCTTGQCSLFLGPTFNCDLGKNV